MLRRHQADAEERGDEQADRRRRRQPEVLDDLDVLTGGELRQQERRGHQQHREEYQAVRDAIANRVAEDTAGDNRNRPHDATLPIRSSSAARTC
jgi:hypothetical protein